MNLNNIEKSDRYYEEGCADCGTSKKLSKLEQRSDTVYNILIEKIDKLTNSLDKFTIVVQSHEVTIATINNSLNTLVGNLKLYETQNTEDHRQIHSKIQRKSEESEQKFNTKIDRLENRQFELVKELNQSIGRRTMTPVIISVATMFITIISILANFK